MLANIIKELKNKNEFNISLLVSNTVGCLSNISNISYYDNHYRWSTNRIVLLFKILFTQIYIFFFILRKSKNIDIIYINTILPFSAAIAGKILRKKIIYHVHEVYIKPNFLQKIMWFVMEKYSTQIISISQYVCGKIKRKSVVIYNSVSHEFEIVARKTVDKILLSDQKYSYKNILMICSLRKYKGVDVFVSLARKCPGYSFSLILSCLSDEIKKYFSYTQLPINLEIMTLQTDLIPYYQEASILINLTLPDLCIETFGMTLIEGMQFGTPCIAPNFGGPREIIINNENGFLVNPYDEDAVISAINVILDSKSSYMKFFDNVLRLKDRFSAEASITALVNELNARV